MKAVRFTRSVEFRRGVVAAAAVADHYNASSTHPYRLGDCILGKLNVTKRRTPRGNRGWFERVPDRHWIRGFAIALAETHRYIGNSSTVCSVARDAGLTLRKLRLAGVDRYDLRELAEAGVK